MLVFWLLSATPLRSRFLPIRLGHFAIHLGFFSLSLSLSLSPRTRTRALPRLRWQDGQVRAACPTGENRSIQRCPACIGLSRCRILETGVSCLLDLLSLVLHRFIVPVAVGVAVAVAVTNAHEHAYGPHPSDTRIVKSKSLLAAKSLQSPATFRPTPPAASEIRIYLCQTMT
ncbi:unnamed protein product [Protopolystoma xenopodis]|uniref:Uncharacterized protein n=1 Tax=Protopolystoma xenopodis TaxID=117903 RepID=A0A448X2Y0_9PLAT|nr:unnamed protein product [Protopolystoma xenopodis]